MTQQQIDRWIRLFDLDDSLVNMPARAPVAVTKPRPKPPSDPAKPREAQEIEQDTSGEVLPRKLIEQAEEIWSQQSKRPPHDPA
jgi:hypothetical protein